MQSIRQRIDAFMGDQKTRELYDGVVNKGQELQQKQQASVQLTGDEIADFEQQRDALLKNPVARDFLDAQEEMHEMQHTVQKYVKKALELGRLPTEEDLSSGCGNGGSCHCH
jgi:cell fate (sporulation/competence/biofilm development) regulator YlbF (YheA/YmcA/DUF963 family)